MNKLPFTKQAAILKALTEGASVRATARMVGVSKTTVMKLLVEAGRVLRDLPEPRPSESAVPEGAG